MSPRTPHRIGHRAPQTNPPPATTGKALLTYPVQVIECDLCPARAYSAPGSLHGDRVQDSFLARGWRNYVSRQGCIQACPRCGRRLLARGLEPVAHDLTPATRES